jgi:hypothetical protein
MPRGKSPPIPLGDPRPNTRREKVTAADGQGDSSRQLCRTLKQKLVSDFSEWKTEAFEGGFQE